MKLHRHNHGAEGFGFGVLEPDIGPPGSSLLLQCRTRDGARVRVFILVLILWWKRHRGGGGGG